MNLEEKKDHVSEPQKRKETILSLISRLRTYEIRKALIGSKLKLLTSDNRLMYYRLRHLSREISKILGQIYSLLNAL
jgi:hypothetical protein